MVRRYDALEVPHNSPELWHRVLGAIIRRADGVGLERVGNPLIEESSPLESYESYCRLGTPVDEPLLIDAYPLSEPVVQYLNARPNASDWFAWWQKDYYRDPIFLLGRKPLVMVQGEGQILFADGEIADALLSAGEGIVMSGSYMIDLIDCRFEEVSGHDERRD